MDALNTLSAAGITLRVDGDALKASGRLTPEHRQLIREHKAELLEQLKAATDTHDAPWGQARQKVLSDLRHHPSIRYAAEVDASGNPVRIMLAVRDVGSCILEVDAQRWNLEGFIALMDRQAGLRQEVAA